MSFKTKNIKATGDILVDGSINVTGGIYQNDTPIAGVTSVGATAPVASSGGTTPNISMPAATSSVNGYLASADWTTFNNKTSNTGNVSWGSATTDYLIFGSASGDIESNSDLQITSSNALYMAPSAKGGIGISVPTGSYHGLSAEKSGIDRANYAAIYASTVEGLAFKTRAGTGISALIQKGSGVSSSTDILKIERVQSSGTDSGTAIAVATTGAGTFTGDFMDFHNGTSSVFNVDINGNVDIASGATYSIAGVPIGSGGGGGDVGWSGGSVGSNNQLITAIGDGSIGAESQLTFADNVLTISKSAGANIYMGDGVRSNGRAEIALYTDTSDGVSEIQFGWGGPGSDTSIRWVISDRGTTSGVLNFYEAPGLTEATWLTRFSLVSGGGVVMGGLSSNDTEDHIVAIDDGTGLLTKRSVSSLPGGETITLSGDVTGSGTSAITTTVVNDSHTHTVATITGLSGTNTGDNPGVTSVSGGTGIDSTGGDTPSLTFNGYELAVGGTLLATDWLIASNSTVSNRQLISNIPLSIFNNDEGWTAGGGTITLSGDVTGSGTSAITTTVGNDSHSHTGTTISALDTADITAGTLSVARGGTGASTLASNTILTGNGTSAITAEATLQYFPNTLSPPDGSDYPLTIAAGFADDDSVAGTLTLQGGDADGNYDDVFGGYIQLSGANGHLDTGGSVLISGGYGDNENGDITIDGNTISLSSSYVYAPYRIYHEGDTDTFMQFDTNSWKVHAGNATYEKFTVNSTGVVVNEDSQDSDFRIESNSYTHSFYLDGATGKINIGENSSSTMYKMLNVYQNNTDTNILTGVGKSSDDDGILVYNPSTASGVYANIDFATEDGYPTTYNAMRMAWKAYTTSSTSGNYLSFVMYNGSMLEQFRFNRYGTFYANGDIVAYSTTIGSDIRLKKNVETVKHNSLERIMKTRAVTFDWIDKNRQRDEKTTGYIAQELEEIFPELILEVEPLENESGDKTKYKHIRYNEIIPHITNAMQEQQEIITNQQKEIDELKEKMNQILEKLS